MNKNLLHQHYEKSHFDKMFEQIIILSSPERKDEKSLNILFDVWEMPYWKKFFQAYFAYRNKEAIYSQIKPVLENQTFYYYQDFDNAVLCLLPTYEEMTGKKRSEAIADLFDTENKGEQAHNHQIYYNYTENLDLIKQYSQLVQDLINLLNHNDNNEYQLNLYEKVSVISDRLSLIAEEYDNDSYFAMIHSRLDNMFNSLDFNDDERKSLLYIQKSLQQFEIGDPDLLYPPYLNQSLMDAVLGESFAYPLYEIRDREYFKRHLGIQRILESFRDKAADNITRALNLEENPLQYQDDWDNDLPLNPAINKEIKNLSESISGLNEFIQSDIITRWLEAFEKKVQENLWTYRDLFAFFRVLPFLYPKNIFQIRAFEKYAGIIINSNQFTQDTQMEEQRRTSIQDIETTIPTQENVLTENEYMDNQQPAPNIAAYIQEGDEFFFIDRLDNSEENQAVYDECMEVAANLFNVQDPEEFENKLKATSVFEESLFKTLKFAYHTLKGDFSLIGCPYFSETFAFAEHLLNEKISERIGLQDSEIEALSACRTHFIQQYNRYQKRNPQEIFEIYTPLFGMQEFMIQRAHTSAHLFNFNHTLEIELKQMGFEVKHFDFVLPNEETPIEKPLDEMPMNHAIQEEYVNDTGNEQLETRDNVSENFDRHTTPTHLEVTDDPLVVNQQQIKDLENKIDYLVSAVQILQNQSSTLPLIWRDVQNDMYWVRGQYRFGNYEFTEFLGEVREIVDAVTSYTDEIEDALGKNQEVDKVNWDFLTYLFGTMNKLHAFKFSQNASMLLAWHNLLMFTYQNNIPMNDELILINKVVCQTLQENILMPENRIQEDCHFAINLLQTSLKTLEFVNFQSNIQKQIDELLAESNQSSNNKFKSIMESITSIREQMGESFQSANRNHVAISNTLNHLDSSLKQSNLTSLADIVETMAKDNQKANMKINENIKRTGWLVQMLAQFMGLDVASAWKKYNNKNDEDHPVANHSTQKKKGFFARLRGK